MLKKASWVALSMAMLLLISMFYISPVHTTNANTPAVSSLLKNNNTNKNVIQHVKNVEGNIGKLLKAKKINPKYMFEPNFNAVYSKKENIVKPLYTTGPAPMGIAYYGTFDNSTFITNTTSYEAMLNLSSFNASYPGDTQNGMPNSVSVQLNTVLSNVTLFGNDSYVFWTQNVVEFNGRSMQFIDNIWNFSNSNFEMSMNSMLKHSGILSTQYYYAIGPSFNISYPFSLKLYNNATVESNNDAMYFNYSLYTGGKVYSGSYDMVIFSSNSSKTIVPPHFEVNGRQYTPTTFIPYDAELIFGGPGDGSNTVISNISGYDTLMYMSNGVYKPINSSYNVGSETGETSMGISTWWSVRNSMPVEHLSQGPSFIMPLWNESSGISKGHITISGSVNPSYAFVFMAPYNQKNPMALNNTSYSPTMPDGSFSFNLAPGNYEFEFMANGYSPYFANVSTNTILSVTMTKADLYYTPIYINTNSQLASMSSSGILNGQGTYSSPYEIDNISLKVSPYFTGINGFGYSDFIAVYILNTDNHLIINNITVQNTIFIGFNGAMINLSYPLLNKYTIYLSSNVTISNIKENFTNASSMIAISSITDGYVIFSAVQTSNITLSNNNISYYHMIYSIGLMGLFNNKTYLKNNFFLGLYMVIALEYSNNTYMSYNKIYVGLMGVVYVNGIHDDIHNNTFYNYFNIMLYSIDHSIIYNNSIEGMIALELSNSTHNLIYNNIINAMYNNATAQNNSWNITAKKGTNIIDGPYTGGNYWSGYNAYNETNGFGNAPYNDSGMIFPYDYHPLVYQGIPIFFNETGLPKGTEWSVKLGNTTKESTTNWMVIHVKSTGGKMNYTIYPVSNFFFISYSVSGISEGYLNLTNHTQTVFVKFVPYHAYNAVFNEKGLPQNVLWGAEIIMPMPYFSTYESFTINSGYNEIVSLPNGTYQYIATYVNGYTPVPSKGYFTINGGNTSIQINYVSNVTVSKYTVSFNESGLPANTTWGVTIGNITNYTDSNSLAFTLNNGSYSYKIYGPSSYNAIPSYGIINVSSNITMQIKFVPIVRKYTISFIENGLPAGMVWSIKFNGSLYSNNATSISFIMPNGTYSYQIMQVKGYSSNVTYGNITVYGKNTSVYINWEFLYEIYFVEHGLANTTWSVTFNGKVLSSSRPVITAFAPNGTYSYKIGSIPHYYSNITSGNVTINGSGKTIYVGWVIIPLKYTVTFVESGLPANTSWSVIFNNSKKSSTGAISFIAINGTYGFSIVSIAGYSYTVKNYTNYITIKGKNLTIYVAFSSNTSTGNILSGNMLYYSLGAILIVIILLIAIAMYMKRKKSEPKTVKAEVVQEKEHDESKTDEAKQNTDNDN
ncbi:MAG: thermopsin family protease [Thermoplasmata archaeon]